MAKFDETSTDAAGGRATSSGSAGSLSSSLSSSLASSTSASRERLNDDSCSHMFDDDGTMKVTLSMDREVEAASTFLADIIKASRFNDQTMERFRQALTTLLKQHYDGHWYPNDPFKGSGYRCLRVNGVMNPLLTKAAQLSGLPLTKFRHAFPVEFTVWVDPGDVSVRYGEDGSIGCVYPSSGKGLKHDHQQMEDLKKLVQLQKLQQQQQLQQLLQLQQQQAASHFSQQAQHHHNHRACSTPPPAPVCEKVHISLNHRGSPNTTTFTPGSPPSSSFMFSPYDGKCLKLPSLAAGSQHPQNSSFLTSSRANDQSPPNRKYQAIMQQSILDRRTPPAYVAAAASPSTNMFGGGGGSGGGRFYANSATAAADLISTKNSFSVANQNNRMMLDCDNILMPSSLLARRTPPFRTMTPTNNHQSSPMYHQQQQQQADSDWMLNTYQNHQSSLQQQNANDYQFYTNTHFGSSFTNNTTTTPSSRLVEPLGAAN